MTSSTLTAERAWCDQLRSDLRLAATTFDVTLEEDADSFSLVRPLEGDASQPPRIVLSVDKRRCGHAPLGFADLASYVSSQPLPAIEGEPTAQPTQVHQIAPLLLKPYTPHHGTIHLAGCIFDPRPFLRISHIESGQDAGAVQHRWFGADGNALGDEHVAQLGLDKLKVLPRRLRRDDKANLKAWVEQCGGEQRGATLATVAWCNWASGKIRISFEHGAASIAFEGWAIDFLRGSRKPPPFACPLTGMSSYEVICLEDGTVTVPEGVGCCEVTGRKYLVSQMSRCAVTGKLCADEELVESPISHVLALPSAMARCRWCERLVLPDEIRGGECTECGDLEAVDEAALAAWGVTAQVPAVASWKQRRGRQIGSRLIVKGRRHLIEQAVVLDLDGGTLLRTGRRVLPWGAWKVESA